MVYRRSKVEKQIDGGRKEHAKDSCHHRQHNLPQVAQLAPDELALQFQSHDEEKHRHESVVNPVLHAEVEQGPTVNDETEVMFQKLRILITEGRIGQYQRQNNKHGQHDSA